MMSPSLTSRGPSGGWSPRATGQQPTLSQTAACGQCVWRWCPQAALVTAQHSGARMRRAPAPTGRRGRVRAAGRHWAGLRVLPALCRMHHPCRAPIFGAGVLSVSCGSTTNAQGL